MSLSEPRVYVYRFTRYNKDDPFEYYFYSVSKDLALKQFKKLLKEYYDLDSIPADVEIFRANDNDKPFIKMEIHENER